MDTPNLIGPYRNYLNAWEVRSDNNPVNMYTIGVKEGNVWSCSCPRWTQNASRPECKHISHVKAYLAREREKMLPPPQPASPFQLMEL